jgi:hypothetical protein
MHSDVSDVSHKNPMGNNTGAVLYDKIWRGLKSLCPDTAANSCQRLSAARFPSQKVLPNNSFVGKSTIVVLSQDRVNDS